MAYECGLDERDLEKTMLPRLEPKVLYYDGWVILRNFKKHHVSDKSENSKKGYESALNEVSSHILEYINTLDKPLEAPLSPSDTIASTFAIASASASIPDKPLQGAYGEFKNVLLTVEEYNALCTALTEPIVQTLIAELDEYIESKGVKYKSHRATIQTWARRRINDHILKARSTKLKVI